MCFDHHSCTGLNDMNIEPWLSPAIGTVPMDIPSSSNMDLIHTAWRLQSESAIYSASVDDKATVF